MSDMTNTLALVFGGGRDIGAAISIALARRGAQVALTYNSSNPAETLATIEALGQKPLAQKVDAFDTTAVRNFATWAQQQSGNPINILVNVVGGLLARKKMEEMDDAFWDQVFSLNVKSVFAMTQSALPLMSDGGAIVNVSSISALRPRGLTAYTVSKSAVIGLILLFTVSGPIHRLDLKRPA